MKCKFCGISSQTAVCDECSSDIMIIKEKNKLSQTDAENQYLRIWNKRIKKEKQKKQLKKQSETQKYSSYLTSNKWKNIKNSLFIEFNYQPKCFCCGSKENIQVHHKTYKNVYNECQKDLVCLCKVCHENVHSIVKTAYKHRNTNFPLRTCHNILKVYCLRYGSPIKAYTHLIRMIKEETHLTMKIEYHDKTIDNK